MTTQLFDLALSGCCSSTEYWFSELWAESIFCFESCCFEIGVRLSVSLPGCLASCFTIS